MIFALILMSVTGFTGLIYLLDVLYFAKKRIKGQKESIIIEYSKSFFPVLLAVFVIRSFIVEPFKIPSGSMMPTLLIGDFIAVNKFSYGVRFPVANTVLIPNGMPERGDVVVFHFPKNPSIDYIKRLVGLPGDTIKYQNKKLFINDKLVPNVFEKDYESLTNGFQQFLQKQYSEKLGDIKHSILMIDGYEQKETIIQIPEGHYFVMGDNRDNSSDSRVWGLVSEDLLVGKAFLIWFHFEADWAFPDIWNTKIISWKPSRIGDTIK